MKFLSKIKILFKPSKYSKKIFIENWGFENRGDQLMIQSVMEQIRKYEPHAQILVRKHVFEQNHTYCIQNRLYPLLLNNHCLKAFKPYAYIMNLLLRDNWFNAPRDIDVILNCRGYYIADCWIEDENYVVEQKKFYSQFTKPNCKLVMLPQAFGPFGNEASRKTMEIVHDRAEIIYARENMSYKYLRELFPGSKKINVAPDFTCLVKPDSHAAIQLPHGEYILIIPNSRMLDKTDKQTSNTYLDFLVEIVNYIQSEKQSVYLLNHEGESDEQLLYLLNEKLDKKLPILTKLSGVEIKSLIANCKLLISARFHGVVSGLTQGVPTLCSSWSHKYTELLHDYECDGNILDVTDTKSAKDKIKAVLENPQEYSSKEEDRKTIEQNVNMMWEKIFKEII